jgi:hypothetical protein
MRPMMSNTFTVYAYDEWGYFNGETMEVPYNGGYPGPPARWTNVPVPQIPVGMYAVFDHVQWSLTSQPHPLPPTPESPVEEPVANSNEPPQVI